LYLLNITCSIILALSGAGQSRTVFKGQEYREIKLLLTQGDYALVQYGQKKEVIKVGDSLCSSESRVLAITKNKVLFKHNHGYGLMKIDLNGLTLILVFKPHHTDLSILKNMKVSLEK